ncbi:MAG: flippase [Bacteroidota bacterium]
MVFILKKLLRNKDIKRISKNFSSLVILQGANFILPLITLPYLVRVLGTERFGLVMFAQSFALFFNVLVDFGFNLSATREISINRYDNKKINEIFSSVFVIKMGLILLSLIIISGIVMLIPRFNIDWEIYFLSFGVVIGQALFPIWYFQGIEKMSMITMINVLAKLVFTILIFVLIKFESDYLMVPVYNSVGFILAGVIGLFSALKHVNFVVPNYNRLKNLFKESAQLFVSNLSVTLYTTGNTIILGLFTNNTMVGVYSSMEKLVLAVKNLYTPIFQAIFPWLSSKNYYQIIRLTKRLILPLFTVGVIISMTIFFFANFILDIIYDNGLITSYSNVFRVLGLIAIFSALNMLFNMLFLSSLKKYKERMKIILFAGIFNVVMALLLVKQFNIYGIAVAVTLTELLLLIFGWYYFNKIKNEEITNLTDSIS